MLRYSLATLEGAYEFVVSYRAVLCLGCSPLSFFVAISSLFFTSTLVIHACRHEAKPRACNKCMALGEVKKREKMLNCLKYPFLASLLCWVAKRVFCAIREQHVSEEIKITGLPYC